MQYDIQVTILVEACDEDSAINTVMDKLYELDDFDGVFFRESNEVEDED